MVKPGVLGLIGFNGAMKTKRKSSKKNKRKIQLVSSTPLLENTIAANNLQKLHQQVGNKIKPKIAKGNSMSVSIMKKILGKRRLIK